MLPKSQRTRAETGKNSPASASASGPGQDYAASVAGALRRGNRHPRQATKTLMRWTGAGERTVRDWLSGTRGPSGEHLVALVRHSDEVFAVFLRLAGREPAITNEQLTELRRSLEHAIAIIDGQAG